MRSKLVLSFFICASVVAKADIISTNLIIWAKNGTKVAYALAEKPKVTFTETDLVIMTKGVEVSYPLESMARFTYEEDSETSVTELKAHDVSFKTNGESLLFPELKANSNVSVCNLNGTLVFQKTIMQNGEYVFPLSNLDAGVYLVKVNNLTYKIVKK